MSYKIFLLTSVVITLLLLYQLICPNGLTYAVDQLDRYWMVLSGDQHIPPINTNAIGFVGLKFQDDTTRLIYNVNLDNISNVTGVYLYYMEDSNNRTKVLDFMLETRESNKGFIQVSEKMREGKVTGTICYGGITKEDLDGPLKGKTLSNLRDLMTDGKMYVGVSTKNYHDGEIGGNLFIPIDRVFPDMDEFKWS
jgi:hypothetical protein